MYEPVADASAYLYGSDGWGSSPSERVGSASQSFLEFDSPTSVACLPLTVCFMHEGPRVADAEKGLKYGVRNPRDMTLGHIWPPVGRQLDLVCSRERDTGFDATYPNHG
jgi:hypothetical protein